MAKESKAFKKGSSTEEPKENKQDKKPKREGSFIHGGNFFLPQMELRVVPVDEEDKLSPHLGVEGFPEDNALKFSVMRPTETKFLADAEPEYSFFLHSPPSDMQVNFQSNVATSDTRYTKIMNYLGGELITASFSGTTRSWHHKHIGVTNIFRGETDSYRNFMEFMILFMFNGRVYHTNPNPTIFDDLVRGKYIVAPEDILEDSTFLEEIKKKPRYSAFIAIDVGYIRLYGKFSSFSYEEVGPYNYSFNFDFTVCDIGYTEDYASDTQFDMFSFYYNRDFGAKVESSGLKVTPFPLFKKDIIVRDMFLRVNQDVLGDHYSNDGSGDKITSSNYAKSLSSNDDSSTSSVKYKDILDILPRVATYNKSFVSYQMSYSLEDSSCSFVYALTDFETYAFLKFQMSPVHIFSEVELFETGRFPIQKKGDDKGLEITTPYYRRFWGVAVSKNISTGVSGGKVLSVNCNSILYFLKRSKFPIGSNPIQTSKAIYLQVDSKKGSDKREVKEIDVKELSMGAFSQANMNIFDLILWSIMRAMSYFIMPESQGSVTAATGDAKVSESEKIVWSKTREDVQSYWAERLSQVTQSLKFYGISDATFYQTKAEKSGKAEDENPDLYKVKVSLDTSYLTMFNPRWIDVLEDKFKDVEQTDVYEYIKSVTSTTGMEFYQDVDGSMVIKFPFYNLNIFNYKPFTVETLDIINIDYNESMEGINTFCEITGSLDSARSHDKAIWAFHIDSNLAARFGLVGESKPIPYINTIGSAKVFAINYLTLLNLQQYSLRLQIKSRPELKIGFPIYIKHLDVIGYVTEISRSGSVGSNSDMDVTLTGLRFRLYNKEGNILANLGIRRDIEVTEVDIENSSNTDFNAYDPAFPGFRYDGAKTIPVPEDLDEINLDDGSSENTPYEQLFAVSPDPDGVDSFYPVTDRFGFTVVGGLAYGRGMKISSDGQKILYDFDMSLPVYKRQGAGNNILKESSPKNVSRNDVVEAKTFKELEEKATTYTLGVADSESSGTTTSKRQASLEINNKT